MACELSIEPVFAGAAREKDIEPTVGVDIAKSDSSGCKTRIIQALHRMRDIQRMDHVDATGLRRELFEESGVRAIPLLQRDRLYCGLSPETLSAVSSIALAILEPHKSQNHQGTEKENDGGSVWAHRSV
ncbi:MAG: hypothetical protein ACI8W8_005127 [Rhodothermales bacterium]